MKLNNDWVDRFVQCSCLQQVHIAFFKLEFILGQEHVSDNLWFKQGKVLSQAWPGPVTERREHHVNIWLLVSLFPSFWVKFIRIREILRIIVEFSPPRHDHVSKSLIKTLPLLYIQIPELLIIQRDSRENWHHIIIVSEGLANDVIKVLQWSDALVCKFWLFERLKLLAEFLLDCRVDW